MKKDNLSIESQVGFLLYVCSREGQKFFTKYHGDSGLTYTQYLVMMVMWAYKDTTSKELGNALDLDSGTLTPLLRKLEERDLITKKRNADDARNLDLEITKTGEELCERIMDKRKTNIEHINNQLSDDNTPMTRDELRELRRLLNKYRELLSYQKNLH